ncbi:MAG: hypothetical protein LBL66_06515 [Clostridiales bacterium]|jgi:hypothetical protein|nr:hypothetical protein [Clostridiales bacterium]
MTFYISDCPYCGNTTTTTRAPKSINWPFGSCVFCNNIYKTKAKEWVMLNEKERIKERRPILGTCEDEISQSINRTKIIEYVELLKEMGFTIYETPDIPIATRYADEPLIPVAAQYADEPLMPIERPQPKIRRRDPDSLLDKRCFEDMSLFITDIDLLLLPLVNNRCLQDIGLFFENFYAVLKTAVAKKDVNILIEYYSDKERLCADMAQLYNKLESKRLFFRKEFAPSMFGLYHEQDDNKEFFVIEVPTTRKGYARFYGIALNGIKPAFVYSFRNIRVKSTFAVTEIKITGSIINSKIAACEPISTQKSIIELIKDTSKLDYKGDIDFFKGTL